MPTVGSPNAESDDMAQGLQQLGQGIGQMISGKRKWDRDQAIRDLAQENWERNFALQQQQFDFNKAAKEQELARQRQQDEWLKRFYGEYFGNDPEVTELQKLLAKYQRPTEDSMFMAGLNPLLMK
jgi:ribosomal protein S4